MIVTRRRSYFNVAGAIEIIKLLLLLLFLRLSPLWVPSFVDVVIFKLSCHNSLNVGMLLARHPCLGSKVCASVRALAPHQYVPGSIRGPGVTCGLNLLLVLYSAPSGFTSRTLIFLSPQKPTFPNSNPILECTDISEWTSSCELLDAPWVYFTFTLLLPRFLTW